MRGGKMRNLRIFFFLTLFLFFEFYSIVIASKVQNPTGDWILNKIDENLTSDNKIIKAKMIIHLRRTSRTIEFKSYIHGIEKAFTEFLFPPREKGTKMLKLRDQLWMFSPWTERTILISGHMLRQSVMGSDLSYEDMMEDPKLANSYNAELKGEEKIMDSQCWVLELKAKSEDVAYPKRKIWVDKEKFVILKEERYARGGTLLKMNEVKSLRKEKNRWIPERVIFKDMLKSGDGTEFIIESIEFDAEIPEHIFTKASLK
jgi:outer membrane lipoprotein-sorting protein